MAEQSVSSRCRSLSNGSLVSLSGFAARAVSTHRLALTCQSMDLGHGPETQNRRPPQPTHSASRATDLPPYRTTRLLRTLSGQQRVSLTCQHSERTDRDIASFGAIHLPEERMKDVQVPTLGYIASLLPSQPNKVHKYCDQRLYRHVDLSGCWVEPSKMYP